MFRRFDFALLWKFILVELSMLWNLNYWSIGGELIFYPSLIGRDSNPCWEFSLDIGPIHPSVCVELGNINRR